MALSLKLYVTKFSFFYRYNTTGFKNQGRFGLVESRDAEGVEVERLRKSNTPQSLLYNTDTSEDLPFQDNLNPEFF